MRHGVPACDHRTPIRGRDLARWTRQYDAAPLDLSSVPPAALRTRAATMRCVVTSTLRRSIDSAALLAPERSVLREALFDEVGIPTAISLPVAMRAVYWGNVARVAWAFGWSPGTETLRAAITRAEQAADRLVTLARTHGSVMLVGHGMLNSLINRALRQRGWIGAGPPRKYWGCVALEYAINHVRAVEAGKHAR